MKKKVWISLSGIITMVIVASVYYNYFSNPSEFLSEGELIDIINEPQYGFDSLEILDTIYLDDKHVFVPFAQDQIYGTSFWKWEKRNWEMKGFNTRADPYLWQLDPNDPNTFYVTWNLDPANDLSQIDLYLINRRGFRSSNYYQTNTYTPGVQLRHQIETNLDEASYGVERLPKEWITFLETYLEVEGAKSTDDFFSTHFHVSSLSYGWIPRDHNGLLKDLNITNGYSSRYGRFYGESILRISDDELE
ncbi:hypothetical protein BpOF4_17730 [Alkalihalophilus pseudofirmus OF4]|uniref:Uncharacterized protein n=1 Tax=Alkalihalophilus pseudofirmus (strain ATCC BAA-2126 / JCM 17055 / OF4) TaxID=398511 RepID=D3FRJ6_ALKPO|nr:MULTISPECIES: hypothetical protein [Alkalihalophilus]ADC51587.1 hypothetical protein BpOF4_17730 [Alkalihalophilus pseudofirmus OF4]MED1603376.1 hypothetical protein [Alkalihalophilus marmarensis]